MKQVSIRIEGDKHGNATRFAFTLNRPRLKIGTRTYHSEFLRLHAPLSIDEALRIRLAELMLDKTKTVATIKRAWSELIDASMLIITNNV